jgi:hypothetical protein
MPVAVAGLLIMEILLHLEVGWGLVAAEEALMAMQLL